MTNTDHRNGTTGRNVQRPQDDDDNANNNNDDEIRNDSNLQQISSGTNHPALVNDSTKIITSNNWWHPGECGIVILCIVIVTTLFGVCNNHGSSGGICQRNTAPAPEAVPFAPAAPSPSAITTTPPPTTSTTSSSTHEEEIIAFINTITLTGRTIHGPPMWSMNNNVNSTDNFPAIGLLRPIHAEERALELLLLLLQLSSNSTNTTTNSNSSSRIILRPDTIPNQLRIQQRYALLTLYVQQEQRQNNTNKETSKMDGAGGGDESLSSSPLSSFEDDDECNWYGVVCTTNDTNVTQQQLFRPVVEIYWNHTNTPTTIQGTLSPELGLLSSHLQRFTVQHNRQLRGSLPSTIGQYWTNLVHVSVRDNNLTGTIPMSIVNWTQLQSIDLGMNDFTGTLPAAAMRQWTNLQNFAIDHNRFNGTIPTGIVNWTSTIESINLGHNNFTGTVPNGLCSAAVHLNYLAADCGTTTTRDITCNCCTVCT